MIKSANLMKFTQIIFVVLMVLLPFSVIVEPQGKLIIFHAGSLTVPFAKIEKMKYNLLLSLLKWVEVRRNISIQPDKPSISAITFCPRTLWL